MMMHRAAIAAATFRSLKCRRNSVVATPVASLRWMKNSFSSVAAATGEVVSVPSPPTSNHHHVNLPHAQGSIIYTETDEAPALATYSLYPVVAKIGALASIDIIPCDISLSGRVLCLFPEFLKENQRVPNNLAYLGELVKSPEANIIKLPNSKCYPQVSSMGFVNKYLNSNKDFLF
jgi:hypothetical protein